jgi:NAD(P)-dependent dehydrogenase (short-subunit alcohol dehydrogenase family)
MKVLIHNAAAAIGSFKLTTDGLESQFGTDHVGPFLLTKLLAPKLLSSKAPSYTPRVVFVASSAHTFGTGVDFAVLTHPDPAKYQISDAYFQAKSANILTAIELSKRSKGAINAYSLHPGGEQRGYIQMITLFTGASHLHEYHPEGGVHPGVAGYRFVLVPHSMKIY